MDGPWITLDYQVAQKRHIQTTSFLETSQDFKVRVSLRLQQAVATAIGNDGDISIEGKNSGACHRAHFETPVEG